MVYFISLCRLCWGHEWPQSLSTSSAVSSYKSVHRPSTT